MARWILCVIDNIWNFATFNLYTCASKNPLSPKVFNRFSKSLPQLEDVEGGHFGAKLQVSRYFTFAMARWNRCASTTFEILRISTCTLCMKKSYISKGVQPIFEIFASARRCWRWAYVSKISGAQIWYFCNGKVKTLRMYNIWNIPLSTCTLCLQKSYISKAIQPIFEIFATARRFRRWTFGRKVSRAQVFYFCNGKVKTCACTTFEISHFQPVHFACKNPISPKVFNRFSKSLPHLEAVEGGHLEGKLQERSYLSFAMARLKLCACTTFEISHFQPVDCACINPICRKVFNRFSKSWAQLEDVEGGHLGGKIQARRYFTFAMARWKPCACTTFEISHFQSVHCPSKNPISRKVFNRFSKSLPQLDDVECGHFGVKIEARSYFTFAMARWELCHLQHLKFPTFNLYTVPAKILYLQRYSTDFRNLCLSKESLRMDIWVASLKCAGILLLKWQGENFASRNIWNFATFNLHTVSAKILYLQRYSTDFRNLCLSSKIMRVGIRMESFRRAGILIL